MRNQSIRQSFYHLALPTRGESRSTLTLRQYVVAVVALEPTALSFVSDYLPKSVLHL